MVWDFAKTAAMIILFGFFWRYLTVKNAGTRLGGAMSFIY